MFQRIELTWTRCQGSAWCRLEKLDLSTVDADGVYIIWYEGAEDRAVYVGQGKVADRLSEHNRNEKVLAYRKCGTLLVTWANVQDDYKDAVESRLADEYQPLEGTHHPDVYPVEVNLPW